MNLAAPVTSLPGIGPVMGAKLAKLGIYSLFDLLYHLPFRYEDRSLVSTVSRVQPGQAVTLTGTLDSLKNEFTHHGKFIQKGQFSDSSGTLPLVWFNQAFLTRTLKPKTALTLYGKVEFFGPHKTLVSPDYELLTPNHSSLHMGRVVPVYPETSGVTSKWLRVKIFSLLSNLRDTEIIPERIPSDLPSWRQSLLQIHFPDRLADVPLYKRRLAFDELFFLQLSALIKRSSWKSTRLAHTFHIDQEKILDFTGSLPFHLTQSQSSVLQEIFADLSADAPMNRLLEGDVGSGKTVVAALAAYVAYLNGFTSLFLAPTQILAAQHHQTLTQLFAPFGIEVGLVTGNTPKSLKTNLSRLKIIVGTHALLSSASELTSVGLVVIDEQHRFGVSQRALAASLGRSPHILTMTATPIPRTIALTLLGDLDLSVLQAPPSGRLPIKTWVVPESKRPGAYTWIASQISSLKSQVFIVCPFIEPSESMATVKAVTAEFANLTKTFHDFKLGLLHGKLTVAQKNQVIDSFRRGDIDILVATPVVEVGIDIPNASVMVIEGADRFGLAQLHQLRGRVGRSSSQSYCLLFSPLEDSSRLTAMETHHSGLELAEIDLRLRGPGQIYGTAQHGLPQFKIAGYTDLALIGQAKQTAEAVLPVLKNYPVLHSLARPDKINAIQPN